MESTIYAQSKIINKTLDEEGLFEIVPCGDLSIMINHILITVNDLRDLENDSRLILRLFDGVNSAELIDVYPCDGVINIQFNLGMTFWRGASIEILKKFKGKVTVTINYNKIPGMVYDVWKQ